MPISAPDSVVAISFSRSVGTPQASAASSSSRMVAKPKPSRERSIARAIAIAATASSSISSEQILDVGQREPEDVDRRRADHIGAARAADIIPVDDQRLQHDRERERRDREERAAQPQRQIAHAEPDDAGHDPAEQDQHRDRQRVGLVEEHRRVGADREERRRAEIHIAAIAAEDVPGGRQHDELQHHVAGEEQIVVVDHAREHEDRGGNRDADSEENA